LIELLLNLFHVDLFLRLCLCLGLGFGKFLVPCGSVQLLFLSLASYLSLGRGRSLVLLLTWMSMAVLMAMLRDHVHHSTSEGIASWPKDLLGVWSARHSSTCSIKHGKLGSTERRTSEGLLCRLARQLLNSLWPKVGSPESAILAH